MPAHVIAANDLRSGRLLYLGPGDDWIPGIAAAEVAEGEEALAALRARAALAVAANVVTAARPVPVEGGEPTQLMERIGARGPTVRADLNRPTGLEG